MTRLGTIASAVGGHEEQASAAGEDCGQRRRGWGCTPAFYRPPARLDDRWATRSGDDDAGSGARASQGPGGALDGPECAGNQAIASAGPCRKLTSRKEDGQNASARMTTSSFRAVVAGSLKGDRWWTCGSTQGGSNMTKRFFNFGLTAGLVLIGTAAFAQQAAPAPSRGAIEIGLRAGFGLPFGSEGKTASDASWLNSQRSRRSRWPPGLPR